jgi:lysophospholipase L1-like esterase
MKAIATFLFIFFYLISCTKKTNSGFINPASTVDTPKTYLALGDSYTIGESVSELERYPAQTVALLRLQNLPVKEPDIIAATGWTTTELIDALNNDPPENNYAIVSLLIGVNNQYRHESLEEYKAEFAELLKRSIEYAGNNKNRVFVLSIPDYGVTPFAANSDTAEIGKEIDEFNEANKTMSLDAGVHYIDIIPISREAKYNLSLVANDGLHPSALQYKQWSELLASTVKQELH